MRSTWTGELTRVVAFLVMMFIVGLWLGYGIGGLVIGLLFYIGWNLYWAWRLHQWLTRDRRAVPPEAPGIWGEIFHQLWNHYRRNRQRRQRLAALFRSFRESTAAMPDGVVVLDDYWQIIWFNEAGARLLGLSRTQDIGQRIANLLRSPAFTAYLENEEFEEPIEIVSPLDDDRRLSLQIVPYTERESMLLFRDVTRMHRLEQMRREFVANASHELRSPLTVISGYLEAMSEDAHVQAEWDAPVAEMRRQATRMSGIISDLLELSRLETADESFEGESVDVKGLLARIREEALAMGEGPADISLEIETDTRLLGIEREIYSAFSNVVFNAARYTPATGSIRIRWFSRDGEVCMAVTDTGIGIAEEHLPRLTERFYRVDTSRFRRTGGTGLGLAIVKHVMQRHGGYLEIESTPGHGSTFTCVFPRDRRAS